MFIKWLGGRPRDINFALTLWRCAAKLYPRRPRIINKIFGLSPVHPGVPHPEGYTANLMQVPARGAENTGPESGGQENGPKCWDGKRRTEKCGTRLMGQHLSDGPRDLLTITFNFRDHGAYPWYEYSFTKFEVHRPSNSADNDAFRS